MALLNGWGFRTEAEGGSPRWLCDYQRVLVNAFVDIEMTGFPFDSEVHRGFVKRATNYYDLIKTDIMYSDAMGKFLAAKGISSHDFNLNSPKDLVAFLYSEAGLNHTPLKVSKKTEAPSTDKETLKAFADGGCRVSKLLLEYRNCGKLLSTFGEPLINFAVDGRIHPSYFLAKVIDVGGEASGTATGRLSCKSPNLQQLPKRDQGVGAEVAGIEVRRSFLPLPGHKLVEADQSQVEVRVAGMYAKDEQMGEFFRLGGDFHTRVASALFKIPYRRFEEVLKNADDPKYKDYKSKRSATKTVVFGLLYGEGLEKLCRACNMTLDEGKKFIKMYFDFFPGLAAWRQEIIAFANTHGYVTTLFGRKRVLSLEGFRSTTGRESRLGVNTPVQSAAADITLYGLSRIWERLMHEGSEARILGTVHDSILLSVPERELNITLPWVVDYMVRPPGLEWLLDSVPIPLDVEVSVGDNWRDMKVVHV